MAVNFIVEQSRTFRRITAVKYTCGCCVNSPLAAKRRLPNVLLKKNELSTENAHSEAANCPFLYHLDLDLKLLMKNGQN